MPFEFPMRGENKDLTPTIRGRLAGAFIQLPDGVTHYELGGPEGAPVIVLVHGFSVPYFIWDTTFEALTAAGFRVLRYDLYGRGYSDRPYAKFDLELFDRQMVNLLEVLGIKHALAVGGLSMGGLVAANFAGQHPEMLDKLFLIDPAGFPLDAPWFVRSLTRPVLGELFFGLIGEKSIELLFSKGMYDPELVDKFRAEYLPATHYKGFKRAILSTIRSGMLEDGEKVYRRLGQTDLPVLLFWGEQDKTVAFDHSKRLLKAVPQAQFHSVAGAGHAPHVEKSDEVHPIMIEFLQHE